MALAYFSVVFICIVWGMSYILIKIGIESVPPFLFSGIRQAIAGAALLALIKISGRNNLISSKRNLMINGAAGILMIGLGNGLVTWSQQHIASGVAALICSMMPVYVILINIAAGNKDKMNPVIVVGLLSGIGGMLILFSDSLKDLGNLNYFMGIVLTAAASVAWSFGSYMAKHYSKNSNALANVGWQMLFGGGALLVTSFFADDYNSIDWNGHASVSLVLLIVFGSIGAFGAYNYAIAKLPLTIVMLYAFVNPVIAVFMGSIFLKESLNSHIIFSLLLIILSLYMVNYGYMKNKKLSERQT